MSRALQAAGVTWAPDRPGPGPMPEALLRALEVSIGRRVDGLLAGDHRSTLLGVGTELAQIRPYEAGDDVRLIDWNVTARTLVPHVRAQLAERALVTWLVLDTSPSMAFGTGDRRKWDVAWGAALALGHAASARGNRVGLVTFGGPDERILPPRQGRPGLLGVMLTLRDAQDPASAPGRPLGEALHRVAGIARQRALVAVVSDFRGPLDWPRALLDVAARHDVLAVEVRDRREQELEPVGVLALVDPETGRRVRVDTRDGRLRARFAEAAAAERRGVADALTRAGAFHAVLDTSSDWLRELAAAMRARRRRR